MTISIDNSDEPVVDMLSSMGKNPTEAQKIALDNLLSQYSALSFQPSYWDKEWLENLSDALQKNKSITEINLALPNSVNFFKKVLEKNTALTLIELGWSVKDTDLNSLAKTIESITEGPIKKPSLFINPRGAVYTNRLLEMAFKTHARQVATRAYTTGTLLKTYLNHDVSNIIAGYSDLEGPHFNAGSQNKVMPPPLQTPSTLSKLAPLLKRPRFFIPLILFTSIFISGVIIAMVSLFFGIITANPLFISVGLVVLIPTIPLQFIGIHLFVNKYSANENENRNDINKDSKVVTMRIEPLATVAPNPTSTLSAAEFAISTPPAVITALSSTPGVSVEAEKHSEKKPSLQA